MLKLFLYQLPYEIFSRKAILNMKLDDQAHFIIEDMRSCNSFLPLISSLSDPNAMQQ